MFVRRGISRPARLSFWAAVLLVATGLVALDGVAMEPVPPGQVKGAIALDYNIPNLAYLIEHIFPDFGINHLQLSHGCIMYAAKVIESEKVQRDFNFLGALAHSKGIRLYVWTHELGYVPEGFFDGARVNLDDPGLWKWLAGKYRKLFELVPNIDGVVLTFSETTCSLYGDRAISKMSNPERVARVTNVIHEVCKEYHKTLYVRTWGPDWLPEAFKMVPDEVRVMSKYTTGDWDLYKTHRKSIGVFGRHPQLIEADICGEYTGQSQVPWPLPEYLKWRISYDVNKIAEKNGVFAGVAARTERYSNYIYETPNLVNLYALCRLVDNPDMDVDEIWNGWAVKEYGAAAAPHVVSAFKDLRVVNTTVFEHPPMESAAEVLEWNGRMLALVEKSLAELEKAEPFLSEGEYSKLRSYVLQLAGMGRLYKMTRRDFMEKAAALRRKAGTTFTGWDYPAGPHGTLNPVVKVRIADSNGIARAVLHYIRSGNGAYDSGTQPALEVSGKVFTFEIPMADPTYKQGTKFYIEAWDRKGNRSLSPLRDMGFERKTAVILSPGRERTIFLPSVDVELTLTAKGEMEVPVNVVKYELNPLESETGLEGKGIVKCLDVKVPGLGKGIGDAEMAIRFNELETASFLKSSLSVFRWNGTRWIKVNSRLDVEDGRVTVEGLVSGLYALAGENSITVIGSSKVVPAVADLDGDGLPEILTGREALNHEGKIQFRYELASSVTPGVADIDGDGKPEIIGDRGVVNGKGRKLFTYRSRSLIPPAVADLDGDGTMETVIRVKGDVIQIYDSKGKMTGSFPVAPIITTHGFRRPSYVAVADVNGDKVPEILTADGCRLYVLDRDGKLVWKSSYMEGMWFVGVADMNGDGRPEILVSGHSKVWAFSGDGKLLWINTEKLNEHLTPPVFADINGDGKLEVLVGSWGNPIWAIDYDGEVIWEGSVLGSSNQGSNPVIVYMNGKLEILTGAGSSYLAATGVFDGRYRGENLWNLFIKTGVWPVAPVVADVNGDGKLELLTVPVSGGEIFMVKTDGRCRPGEVVYGQFRSNVRHTGLYRLNER